jgi:hypothetical protein
MSCHVTGMDEQLPASGFFGMSEEHPMAGVQCEACHGPGAEHSRNPSEIAMLSVNERTCNRCHTDYTDPEFDYNRDVSIVNHGRVDIGLNECFKHPQNSNLK